MSDSYEVGTKAWQPDSTEGWVPSEVEQKVVTGEKVKLVFRLENGEVCLIDIPSSFLVLDVARLLFSRIGSHDLMNNSPFPR
jgi:hypothetical protein